MKTKVKRALALPTNFVHQQHVYQCVEAEKENIQQYNALRRRQRRDEGVELMHLVRGRVKKGKKGCDKKSECLIAKARQILIDRVTKGKTEND
jgi:hypothetical protein